MNDEFMVSIGKSVGLYLVIAIAILLLATLFSVPHLAPDRANEVCYHLYYEGYRPVEVNGSRVQGLEVSYNSILNQTLLEKKLQIFFRDGEFIMKNAAFTPIICPPIVLANATGN